MQNLDLLLAEQYIKLFPLSDATIEEKLQNAQIVENLALIARHNGVIALEGELEKLEDNDFLKSAISLIIDAYDEEEIRQILRKKMMRYICTGLIDKFILAYEIYDALLLIQGAVNPSCIYRNLYSLIS